MRPLNALVAAAAIAGLAACPSSGPKSSTGPAQGPGDDSAVTEPPPRPPPPVEGVACEDGPCMVHPGTGNYHECLNGAAGACFQYGRRCVPASKCMLDPSGVYRTCSDLGEGRCESFADPCEPARRCAFDRGARKYRTCEQLEAGKCLRFGDPCSPGA